MLQYILDIGTIEETLMNTSISIGLKYLQAHKEWIGEKKIPLVNYNKLIYNWPLKVVHKGGYNILKIWFDFSAID